MLFCGFLWGLPLKILCDTIFLVMIMNQLPKRKSTRLKSYDYSSPGVYFVTICTKDRAPLLSKIALVGDDVGIGPYVIPFRAHPFFQNTLKQSGRCFPLATFVLRTYCSWRTRLSGDLELHRPKSLALARG